MIYIGHTFVPQDRFLQHLVLHVHTNTNLQEAIAKHTLSKFTAIIFEVVVFPEGADYFARRDHIRSIGQRYIDMFPKAQLYNTIDSVSS